MGMKKNNFLFLIFHYLHFSILFGGNNPHYPKKKKTRTHHRDFLTSLEHSFLISKNIIEIKMTEMRVTVIIPQTIQSQRGILL